MYPSLSLTSSLLLSTSFSTTGFDFGGFFDFVGKSLGQVLATFSFSCPIFQPKTMPNLDFVSTHLCMHLLLLFSTFKLHFPGPSVWPWPPSPQLYSQLIEHLSNVSPAPFLLIVYISHPSSP